MEALIKKLNKIKELIKADVPPSPKPPKPPEPSMPGDVSAPAAPKAQQATSGKDPAKVAAQIKDPKIKDKTMKEADKMKEGIKFNSSGQWTIS